MIKIHCDRCGAEIKDTYYTINIDWHNANPWYIPSDSGTCCISSNSQEETLMLLNATKMYCKDCRDKIEAFINNT